MSDLRAWNDTPDVEASYERNVSMVVTEQARVDLKRCLKAVRRYLEDSTNQGWTERERSLAATAAFRQLDRAQAEADRLQARLVELQQLSGSA